MTNVVPTPKKLEIKSEEKNKIKCAIITHNPKWQKHTKVFADYFNKAHSINLMYESGGIELFECSDMLNGKYRIEISDVVSIFSSDSEGILYALATIMQILDVNEYGEILSEGICIDDYPDKDYRGIMVDLGREWHPFDKLLRYVDICFLYKIKYLNLHFTDTKLYTLPSKAYPKLPTPGMHYSFEQIDILRDYASERGVILVPEFECPGHAPILNQNYPDIFADTYDISDDEKYYTETGVAIKSGNLICAGSEKAWEATKRLFKEICDMFPESPFINIGGDEANIKLWNNCIVCRDYMNKNGIADEKELYSEYIGRVAKYVLSLGKTPLVWEGFPKAGHEYIPKETIVIAWESYYHLPYDLLDEGFRIINSSWQPLYVVPSINERWGTREILKWNVYNWQHWWANSEACLNPINVQPSENVIGAMLCAWEQCYEQEINSVLENLSAMSERVWNVKRVCSDDNFIPKSLKLMCMAAKIIQER